MNHPPKKKLKDPLIPADQQSDDRNLIDLKDAAQPSFEDRVNIYWTENKGFLIGCITVLLLLIIGYQSMRMIKEQSEAALRSKYAEADATNALPEFARTHSDKPLGGFAALTLADKAYNDEDFETALEFYTLASNALEEPILAGRARLGYAFALYNSGQTEEALTALNTIASDTTLAEAIQAEAAYHLAVEAHTEGRATEFSNYSAQINNSELAGQWQQRLQSLPTLQETDSE